MTDLTITAASVVAGSNAEVDSGIAGEAIAAGKSIYVNSTTNRVMLSDSNSATVEARRSKGIALNGAASGQPVDYIKSGDLTVGAVLTANTPYYMSDTPGGICPIADVGTGEYLCQLGLAKSTSVLAVDIQTTGVAN